MPGDHRIGADARTAAHGHGAQHLSAGADDHAVFQRRMALLIALAFAIDARRHAAEGHAMVERDVIADLAGLADHHAHAVVDEEPPADLGARVDLDPGPVSQRPNWEMPRPIKRQPRTQKACERR
jgi:hypothetical protein